MATKTVYLQHEYQQERWGQQAWHKLHQQQAHEHLHAQVAQPVSTARRARCFVVTPWCHMHLMAQGVLESSSSACHPWASLLDFDFLLFYFDLSFPVFFQFSFLMHPEQHTELDNLITMQHNLRTSRRGVTTRTTSPPPSQVMSPTTWSSTSSATPRVPSPTLPRHRTWTYTTLRSASCLTKHTENIPITAVRKVCPSVSRHRLLRSIEQGNLWEKEMSISQLVLVSRETRTVLTASFPENTQAEKVIDRTGKPVGEK